uniref:Urokinase plasminogen activator surface receptor-like n=1 Tax=Nothobranchius furzeri TaxID=105023 RepID=A0A8C6NXB8_NOTFU
MNIKGGMEEWSYAEGQHPLRRTSYISLIKLNAADNMYFFTLVLGLWLLPKADALQCYECLPNKYGSCTETTSECPSQDYQCAAARVTSFIGDSKISDFTFKKCAQAKDCFKGSFNYGISQTRINSSCCTGNLCNTKPAPNSGLVSNGRQCFTCKGTDCTQPLNCEGSEDHCIKATGKSPSSSVLHTFIPVSHLFTCGVTITVTVGGVTTILKGCTSMQFCSGDAIAQTAHMTGVDVSCCQGNFCNSASGPIGGLLLLTVPLISFILFS